MFLGRMKLKNIGTYYVCIYCQHPNYRQNVVIQIAENNNVDTDQTNLTYHLLTTTVGSELAILSS
jgi:hypothetical protein